MNPLTSKNRNIEANVLSMTHFPTLSILERHGDTLPKYKKYIYKSVDESLKISVIDGNERSYH